jgi:hypothetical protein
MCHNAAVGHGSADRTVTKLISLDHDWPYLRQHVKASIRQCPCCQKMDNFRIPVKVHQYVTPSYTPFEVLNIDYVGPYPDDGYALVIFCTFTRWVELYWCQDATAACDCLVQHFGRFGSPSLIRSDGGSHFANDFLHRTGTPHNLTLAYYKQENALVEKEINRHLRACIFDSVDLAIHRTNLLFGQRILNASVHTSMGVSPASLFFGNRVTLDKGILLPPAEAPTALIPASTKVVDMILTQDASRHPFAYR